MFEHLDDPRPPAIDSGHRVAVAERARRIRSRRRAFVAGCAVACITAVLIPLALAQGSDDPKELRTIGDPETTSSVPPTSVEETTTSTLAGSSTTLGGVARTTVAPPVCRNSFDQRCGPFHWDPPPHPNAPMRISITATPSRPKAGEEVSFVVEGEDPDANRLPCHPSLEYGDGETNSDFNTYCVGMGRFPRSAPAYGPWSPPPREKGTFRSSAFTHTYREAGTYTIKYAWATGPERHQGLVAPWDLSLIHI